MVEHGNDVAMFFDADATIVWVSQQQSAGAPTGSPTSSSAAIGFDLVHPDDRQRLFESIQQLDRPGARVDVEFRALDRDGTVHWLEETATRLADDSPAGLVFATMRDVSERRAAQESLQFQADLLAAVGEAVAATDADGGLTYLNPAAEQLYGWSLGDTLGHSGGGISVSPRSGDGDDMVATTDPPRSTVVGRPVAATEGRLGVLRPRDQHTGAGRGRHPGRADRRHDRPE